VRNISIIDRYYPPNPAISGEMACDMATHIIQSFPDVKVTAHYVDVSYLGGGSQMRVAGGALFISSPVRRQEKDAPADEQFI